MKRLTVFVDGMVITTYILWTVKDWGKPLEWINIAVLLVWAPLLVSDIRRLDKPDVTVQLLRGARLALQHFKDYYYAVNRADLEYFTEYHVREYRKLTYAGRLAYNHWRPARQTRKQVSS